MDRNLHFATGCALVIAWLLLGCTLAPIGAVPATPAPGPVPSLPPLMPPPTAQTPTPVLGKALVILSHDRYTNESGHTRIVGEVYNNTDRHHQFVKVKARFYNAARTLVAEEERYAYTTVLLPGEKAPFEIPLTNPPSDAQTYDLEVQSKETDETPFAGLTIAQYHVLSVRQDAQFIIGEAVNAARVHANRVRVVVTAYDARGNVLDVGITYAQPGLVAPGETAPFKLYLGDLHGTPHGHALLVDGEQASSHSLDARTAIDILSTTAYTDKQNNQVIVGEVRNVDDTNVAPVSISAAFYRADGTLVAVESTYAWHDVLLPGERSPFEIELRTPPPGIAHWKLWVRGYRNIKSPAGGLSVDGDKRSSAQPGTHIFRGHVINDGDATMTFVRIVAVVYDGETVLAIKRGYIQGDLPPGAATPFELSIETDLVVTHEKLYVQGRVKKE